MLTPPLLYIRLLFQKINDRLRPLQTLSQGANKMSRIPTVITGRDPGDEHQSNVQIGHTENRDPGDECDATRQITKKPISTAVKSTLFAASFKPVVTGRDLGDEHADHPIQNHEDGHGDVHQPRRSKL